MTFVALLHAIFHVQFLPPLTPLLFFLEPLAPSVALFILASVIRNCFCER